MREDFLGTYVLPNKSVELSLDTEKEDLLLVIKHMKKQLDGAMDRLWQIDSRPWRWPDNYRTRS